MSFKRAGDDHCALRLQKRQRVSELFSEDIPASEVSQTRSGKFVCLICPNNPVLDTMPMLSLHRQGRKHLFNTSVNLEKEHNLRELQQKRKQEQHLKEMKISPSTQGRTLMDSKGSDNPAPLLAKTKELMQSLKKETNRRNDKFSVEDTCPARERELQSKQPELLSKKNKPFFQSRVDYKLCNVTDNMKNHRSKFLKKPDNPTEKDSLKKSSDHLAGVQQLTSPKPKLYEGSSKMTEDEKKKYFDMKISGWILDSQGRWYKDENAEFDSDEEDEIPDTDVCLRDSIQPIQDDT